MGIKKARVARGMSQVELAKRIGVGQSAVSMWETGNAMPRAGKLKEIAEVLGCSVGELIA